MKTSRVLLLLSSLVLVAACGTKGPLVLPNGQPPKRTPAPVELPGSADAVRDEDDAGDSADAADAPQPVKPPTDG